MLLGIVGFGHSAVILIDSFTYPDGDLVNALGSPWEPHSGTGPATVEGGGLVLRSSLGEDVNALLSAGPYSFGAVLYASFSVSFSTLPSSGGSYFAHFRGDPSGFRGLVWASRADAGDGMFRLGVKNSTADSAVASVPLDLALNTEYLVVLRYVVSSGRSTIWINPIDESTGGVSAAPTPSSVPDIGTFAFRQSSGIGTIKVDDLIVGTVFEDVIAGDLPPTISSIPDQSIPANGSTGPIDFAVGDDMTALSELVVSAESDNEQLVPASHLQLSGGEGARSILVTPVNGQQGQATITLTVDDSSATATTSFVIRVGEPVIGLIENQIVPVDYESFPVDINVDDAEEGADGLVVSAMSDNQQLIADGGLIVDGTGPERTLFISPSPGASGLATISVSATDNTLVKTTQFKVTVFPELGILISDNFNRADGPLVDGVSDWDSHSGFYQETQISGQRVLLSQTQIEDVHQELETGTLFDSAGGYVFFASMVVNFSQPPAGDGSYFAHFKDDEFAFRSRLVVSTNNAFEGFVRVGIGNATEEIAEESFHPDAVPLNEDALIVVRLNAATGESRLWVNPNEERSGYVNATDQPAPAPVESFALRQAGNTHGIGVLTVDDLFVATSFQDVTGDLPPIIRFSRSGANLQLSWPSGNGFELRRSSRLPGTAWTIVPAVQAGVEEATNIDISSGAGFFRLQKAGE